MVELPNPPLRRRRILERPRLIRALDSSSARVRMLVAGAGYGKTTLAEQWAAQQGKVAWVRARRSSADVAVLARQMAAASAELLPGSDRRLCERLNVTPDPADALDVLVDLLSADVADWPEDAWVVVDDYHHAKESAIAEAFIEGVLQKSRMQVLLASRERPTWVSTRSVLYGEVLEVGQTMLAMSEDEVDDLLAGAHEGMSSGLLALAGGWPAVVSLASLTTSEAPLPEEGLDIPERLYEFLAEEVYRSLDRESRTGLALLATAPALDWELAAELLGAECSNRVCAAGLSVGVLEERDARLEFHPLAAAFLERQGRRETSGDTEQTVARCLSAYRKRMEWDAAFDLVDRYGTTSDFEALFSDALDALLNAARLATVETWIGRARAKQISSSTIGVAEAELALREGKHLSAETIAQSALIIAGDRPAEAWRAAMVAGRAAHTGSREESALEFYRVAERFSDTPRNRRNALWGQLMASSALELDETQTLLDILEGDLDRSDRYELVRMADKRLGAEIRMGAVRSLANARRVLGLVGKVEDPFARCSFRCNFAYCLNMGAYYDEAREQASLAFLDAVEFRVDPVLPYAHSMVATSLAGRGHYRVAHSALDNAIKESKRCNDEYGMQNVFAIRCRVLVEEGRAGEACSIEPPDLSNSLRSMRGEVLASRGLALATLGHLAEARSFARIASETTASIETRVLVPAIEAICDLRSRTNDWRGTVEGLVNVAFDSGGVDLVVAAYRGNPDLLEALLTSQITKERTMHILSRAGDQSHLQAAELSSASAGDPVASLSPREREIYDLLCEGLSNREIASRLLITEGTVKVHVQHVFDKLGVRSRTALAVGAVRSRRLHTGSRAHSRRV